MLAPTNPAAPTPGPIPGLHSPRPAPPMVATAVRERHLGPALSPRESEVLLLLVEALTDKQIGEALGISPRTVTTHVTSIYNKLGVFSRVAATTYAFRHGFV
jgi:DNA-binding NarL/FixJ family response regulator